jgi:hypothetical protein
VYIFTLIENCFFCFFQVFYNSSHPPAFHLQSPRPGCACVCLCVCVCVFDMSIPAARQAILNSAGQISRDDQRFKADLDEYHDLVTEIAKSTATHNPDAKVCQH